MKVLYVESYYPQLSESYVACEIKYLLAMGVEIEAWRERKSLCPFPEQVPVYEGALKDAIASSKPDILHFHFLSELLRMEADVEASGLPVTLRGHSVDHSPEYLLKVADKPWMKRLWLFPHFARKFIHPKVAALPSCFDPALYQPAPKEKDLVVRACAGIQYKAVEEFVKIAALCPGKKFILIFAHNERFPKYLDLIRDLNESLGNPVELHVNLFHEHAAQIVKRAEISLYTAHVQAHPFGMPVSIVESMASGGLPFIKNHSVPEELSKAAILYETNEGAARAIQETSNWDASKWNRVITDSLQAVANFSAPLVIPKIYWDWTSILKGGAPVT